MSRPPVPPTTELGRALRARRSGRTQRDVEGEVCLPRATLARIERGTHRPSYDTAKALAAWLGWSVEEVMEAAEAPVGAADENA